METEQQHNNNGQHTPESTPLQSPVSPQSPHSLQSPSSDLSNSEDTSGKQQQQAQLPHIQLSPHSPIHSSKSKKEGSTSSEALGKPSKSHSLEPPEHAASSHKSRNSAKKSATTGGGEDSVSAGHSHKRGASAGKSLTSGGGNSSQDLSPEVTPKPRSASTRTESPERNTKPRSASTKDPEAHSVIKAKTGIKIEDITPKRASSVKEPGDHHKPRSSTTKGSKKDEAKKEEDTSVPAPWILEEFSEEQTEKIALFRNVAADFITPEDNDLQIVRWLVARKWDIPEASKMFIESKKWRKTENMDTIFDTVQTIKPFKFLSDYWPISILPEKNAPKIRTVDGYLVIYERLTEMHPDILDIVSLDDMVKFHLYIQELCAKELRRVISEEKHGQSYAGIVYVYDLQSLSLSHLSRANYHMFQVFNGFDANNYPETLRRVFLINAPPIFTMCWKVAKKFLDPVTIKKIVILGNDYLQELLSVIPPESIPKAYGGTLDFLPSGGGPIKGIKKFY